MKTDLILREKLALERTHMASRSTFLAFLRTAMYFLIAALTMNQLLVVPVKSALVIGLCSASLLIFIYGVFTFIREKRWIEEQRQHIGCYQLAYEEEIKKNP